jgi:hypothetical protein
MIINGIDLAGLAEDVTKDFRYPALCKGRRAHFDADFLAYQVSYEKEDDPKTVSDMQENAKVVVEKMMQMAGAEYCMMHLTPSLSDKGGRYDYAMLKEYQGNRKDKPKPRHLTTMRDWLAHHYNGQQYMHCEADDGMAVAQYAAIAEGQIEKSIIVTLDKDLRMVPGYHLDWRTGTIRKYDGFGQCQMETRETATGNKVTELKGHGTKWFWAQMLTGDTADNTQGLPGVTPAIYNKLLGAKTDKVKPCGPVTAIAILDKLKDDAQALAVLKLLYKSYGEEVGFKNWRDGSPVTWAEAFISEARLHWMRRFHDAPDDVIMWMQEECV